MNVLYLYNESQTYTRTVFEHISSFSIYSDHCAFYAHMDINSELSCDLSSFEVIVIHYSIRLAFDQVSDKNAVLLKEYKGLKVLFIQDEYDYTRRAWGWINNLGIGLVFSVVPQGVISSVYPPQNFPYTRFVNVLTGYVPRINVFSSTPTPPSQRHLTIAYRGRPLPARYGKLGQEKVGIGKLVKHYCDSKGITHDISWAEEDRIYGDRWYEFMSSSKAMLGSESGSNVFDWDGLLATKIKDYKVSCPNASDDEIYKKLIQPLEEDGLMNQVSPRIFEAIAAHTVLVLFEGEYSGVVTPGIHFILLKKDGSNLDEVFKLLSDDGYVDAMTSRAYKDIIDSGRYSYQSFVQRVDKEIEITLNELHITNTETECESMDFNEPTKITTYPVQQVLGEPEPLTKYLVPLEQAGMFFWIKTPESIRIIVGPWLRRIVRWKG
jgi:hypothetical protein